MQRCKTQVERLLEIDRQLKENSFPNCSKLARQFEVATKTIHRDIEFMKYRMNAPIEYDNRRKGYYYENPTFMMPAMSMSEGELTALLLASRTLREYQGSPIAGKLRDVFSKLSSMLPDSVSISPVELYSRFTVISPPAIPVKPRIWESVVKGLLQKRLLEIAYEGKPCVYRVKPLHLTSLQGDWRLFVQFEGHDDVRQIALGRIRSLKLLPKVFETVDFNAAAYLSKMFRTFGGSGESHRVKLRFSPVVAKRVLEREWHASQEVIERKNGSVELHFDAKGLVEVEHWVLSWGRHCSVLAPRKLKDQVADEIRSMYGNL